LWAPGAAANAPGAPIGTVTVVASGLNNPRGLAFHDDQLYVAEAGTGGTDCPKGAQGPTGGQLCVGLTGALVRIVNGQPKTVLSGLVSLADIPGGIAASGLAAVQGADDELRTVFGDSVVGVLASIPKGSSLSPADDTAARHELGALFSVAHGKQTRVADVGDSNYSWSAVNRNLVPDQFPDANPNALLVEGRTTYVVDAASNTLSSVDSAGQVTQLAFVPNPSASDAVPTCVAEGPSGDLYLGQLAPGAAPNGGKIYRYHVRTHALTVWQTGFNVVDGCGFDRHGNFYAVEFQAHGFNPGPTGNPAGDVIKISPNGSRSVLGAGKLFYPQGFATDGEGHIFVSNWSIFTGKSGAAGRPTGQVVSIATG